MQPSRSGTRSASTATSSWVRLRKAGGLADQPAEPRVCDLKLEQKTPVANFGVRDAERAGCQPCGKTQTKAGDLYEVIGGTEDQCGVLNMNRERHADAVANIFFQPR